MRTSDNFTSWRPSFIDLHSAPKLPVGLISLPDKKDRRELLFKREIPKDWLENYLPAKDMRRSTADLKSLAEVRQIEDHNKRNLRATEVGCALSHRVLHEWLTASDHPQMLILEDDVIPQPNFFNSTKNIAELLSIHAQKGAAFVCLLGAPKGQTDNCLTRNVISKTEKELPILLHNDPIKGVWRAHAYLISRAAAQNSCNSAKIRFLADDWLEMRRGRVVKDIFFTKQILFGQDETIPSTIRPKNHGESFKKSTQPPAVERALGLLTSGEIIPRIKRSLAFRYEVKRRQITSYFNYKID